MTKSRGILKSRDRWTSDQLTLLRAKYPDTKTADLVDIIGRDINSIYAKAAKLNLKKSAEYLNSPAAARTNGKQGMGTRFQKGSAPANKGLRRPGYSVGRMAETQFKKGNRPHTWRPIGTERHSKEGYLQIKLRDTGVTRRDYVAIHHLVWELHHGPIPPKHHVAFKDRDKTNITIENLELVSFRDMMKRNTLHNYPKEIAQLIQLNGAVQRKINRRLKDEQSDSPSK